MEKFSGKDSRKNREALAHPAVEKAFAVVVIKCAMMAVRRHDYKVECKITTVSPDFQEGI
ncbi:MAG TPA: hypothetical protein P5184_03540 [Bacteroidales bacterium]|nr:hypothetical protein [Bacteroidales bacterium]